MEVCESAALLCLPRALDRPWYPMGCLRAEWRCPLGKCPPYHRGFSPERMANGCIAWRQAGKSIFREMRPYDDDAERSGQWSLNLPDRRGSAQTCGIRDLPYWAVDCGPQGIVARFGAKEIRYGCIT